MPMSPAAWVWENTVNSESRPTPESRLALSNSRSISAGHNRTWSNRIRICSDSAGGPSSSSDPNAAADAVRGRCTPVERSWLAAPHIR